MKILGIKSGRDKLRKHLLLAVGLLVGSSLILQSFGLLSPTAWAAAKPFKIGFLAPLSGVYTNLGQNLVNGITLFFEQQGMAVAGRPIEIIKEDDENTPQTALRKARKLVEKDEVDVLSGVISSGIGYALKDYVSRAKIVWVNSGAAATGIFTKKNNTPYAIRSSHSVAQTCRSMGQWTAKQNPKRVFVTGPDYAMGRESIEAFKRGFKEEGGSPDAVIGEMYAPLNTNDFAAYLTQIKNANPDLIYATYAGTDAVRFVKQVNKFGLRKSMKLIGFGWTVEEDTIPAQGDHAIGWITSSPLGLWSGYPGKQEICRTVQKAVQQFPFHRCLHGLWQRPGHL